MPELLFNLIQSTKPCPDCVTASGLPSMSLPDWESNPLGVPGSTGRVCKGNCHCLLIPEGTDLPGLGDDLLRGDPDTDIPPITGEFPLEIKFGELSVLWRAKFGDMPGRFLKMTLEESIRILELELGII